MVLVEVDIYEMECSEILVRNTVHIEWSHLTFKAEKYLFIKYIQIVKRCDDLALRDRAKYHQDLLWYYFCTFSCFQVGLQD